jgi:hypothetical protein
MTGLTDAAALVDVADLTVPANATISLAIETSPTVDANLFTPIAPPLVLGADFGASSAPYPIKAVRTPSTVALAPLLRWKLSLSAGASGTWGLTFRVRVIPGRSRFFVPTDLTGCAGWFRSDIGVAKGSTNTVSTWADQSGLGHDLAATGNPTWVANTINGQPAISFSQSGGAQFLASAAFAVGTYTLLMVTTGQSGNGYFFTRSTSGVNVDTLYGTTTNTTEVHRGPPTSAWDASLNWGQFASPSLVVQTFDGTHAGHTVTLNGTSIATNSISGSNPGTAATTDKLVIAARDDGFLGGTFKTAEVVLYDHALVPNDLFIVQEYLRRRYALY